MAIGRLAGHAAQMIHPLLQKLGIHSASTRKIGLTTPMEWLAKDGLTVRWCLYVAVVGWLGVYPANAAAQVRPPVTTSGGKLVIPPPTRTIVVADLAGEWGITEGINTTYVDRYTGVYAGTDSLHFT